MKKLPLLFALALLGACANPTTSADDTDKAKAGSSPDRAGAPTGPQDSTAATNVGGTSSVRATDETIATDQAPPEDPNAPGASVTPDANFINSVLADSQFEIQASNRVLQETKDAHVRQFAQAMVTDHTRIGNDLRQLAKAAGMNVTDRLNREQTGLLGRLDKATGKNLQMLYVDATVRGHETATSLFRNAAQSLARPELKAFAAKNLPTIEHHTMMAKALHDGKPMAM